jgi:PIN domain nuclease of toxin-antitoxin system
VRLLLDTHVVLWWLAGDPQMSEDARVTVSAPDTDVMASAVSVWEIAVKRALGKLEAPPAVFAQLAEEGFRELPITWPHAILAGDLPPHHRDPFDRMLVAQAELEGLTVVTRDERIGRYGVPTLAA